EGAQAGRGLARVADARLAVRGPHVAPGEAGDARQVAQEVERRALAGEDRGQRPLDAADDLAGDDLDPVVDRPVDPHCGVDLRERLGGGEAPGDDAGGTRSK